MIGFEGTLLLNILRIVMVVVLGVFFGQVAAIVFHDYAGTIMVLVWLLLFWTIANRYLLAPCDEQDDSVDSTLAPSAESGQPSATDASTPLPATDSDSRPDS